jgi:hypothetical protein
MLPPSALMGIVKPRKQAQRNYQGLNSRKVDKSLVTGEHVELRAMPSSRSHISRYIIVLSFRRIKQMKCETTASLIIP